MLKKIALPLCFIFLSCSPSSPKLEQKKVIEQVSNAVTADFSAKVDILFVIDDSGSMGSYQVNVSKNADALIASIEKNKILDYHIGVITTSMDDYPNACGGGSFGSADCGVLVKRGNGPRYIERSTANGLKLLKEYVKVGINGSASEKFFQPIQAALSWPLKDNENAGFLRDGATLVLIVISDAEDQSVDANGDDYQPQAFVDFLINEVKNGDESQILPYGIVIPSSVQETKDCSRDTGPPLKFEKVLKAFGGYEYNLCDKDFSATLDSLGKDIVKRIPRVAYLKRRPFANSITVKYEGKVIPNDIKTGWTYDPAKNAIIYSLAMIQNLAGTSSNLEVSYEAANDIK